MMYIVYTGFEFELKLHASLLPMHIGIQHPIGTSITRLCTY